MSGVTPAEQQVLDLIDEAELIELTQRLVRCPGVNPPGQEAATVRELVAICTERELDVALDEVAPDRQNVVASLAGGDEPGLMLLGHTDVVPFDDQWTRDPFGGELEGGRIFGRGATDMKGGLAAAVVAMNALRRSGVSLRGAVDLVALVDEEETGIGIRRYVDHADGSYAACLVAEPTDLQVIVAARGDSYHEITVVGRASHSGNAAAGLNAIHGMARIVSELERWTDELAVDAHPLCGPATWSIGTIDGGLGTSTVPDRCHVTVDRRVLPGEDIDDVRRSLAQRLGALGLEERGYGLEVTLAMEMPGFETPVDHALVSLADTAVNDAGGPGLPLAGWGPACDGGFVARDLGVPCVVIGPGSVNDQAHRPDESVGVDELMVAAKAYVLSALRLLG